RWASWLCLPVSAFALLIYSLVFGCSWVLPSSAASSGRRRVWCVFVVAAAALAAAAIWFITLQLFVVRAICPFCMAAHACGLLTAFGLFANVPRATRAPRASSLNSAAPISPATAVKSALGGLAAIVILGVGQIIQPIKTYDVQPLASNAFSTTNLIV